MPSRGQTVSKSQAGSRSKTQLSKRQGDESVHKDTQHGSRQNQPQTAASRQGSRQKQSLVTDTRQGTRQKQPLSAASRRQYESRADRRNETASKSLFTKDGKGKSAAVGEKVTTDHVWNKFLDDKDVVRAPTAESRESRDPEQSQFSDDTRDSEVSGSQGSWIFMFSTLSKIFNRRHIETVFLLFAQQTGFDISCKLSLLATICMKCKILFT